MGNKSFLYIFLFFIVLFLFLPITAADVIKIKNGGELEGVIQEETEDRMVLKIKFGEITLTREDIESVKRASKEENTFLIQQWNKEKQKEKISTELSQKKQIAEQKPKGQPGTARTVKCNDGVHSYSVILPSNYEEGKRCPVLFCFDPGGNGVEAVERFAFVAEKYGWILAGSLNAKNGPWDPILKAQSAMLEDIKKRYNVDQSKYYATGFSGGARMAYTIAYKNPGKFRGVIACGAGFGLGDISERIAVYHCIGNGDSNLNEVKAAHNELKKKGISSELNIFAGGHSYPPDDVLKKAVSWIAAR